MDIRSFFGNKNKLNEKKIVEIVKPIPEIIKNDNNVIENNISINNDKNIISDDNNNDDEAEFEPSINNKINKINKINTKKIKNIIKDDSDDEKVIDTINKSTNKLITLNKENNDNNINIPMTIDMNTDANTELHADRDEDKETEAMEALRSPVPYLSLVQTFELVAATASRLEKERLLARLFRAAIAGAPSELHVLVHLACNSVACAYENTELGVGDSLLVRALCEATGRRREAVDEDYRREGDLGIVALVSRASQKTLCFSSSSNNNNKSNLSAVHVWEQLRKIALTKGDKAQSRKVDLIKAMMTKCVGFEAKYLIRALQGKLRIGTANQTVLVALANAFILTIPPKVLTIQKQHKDLLKNLKSNTLNDLEDNIDENDLNNNNNNNNQLNLTSENFVSIINNLTIKEPIEAIKLRTKMDKLTKSEKMELSVIIVKRAFSECPNLTTLTEALLNYPLYEIHKICQLIPGIPIAPMLAKPTKEIGEVLKRLTGLAFTMEYKYDGERAQIHLDSKGNVSIFSRNSEDNTQKYPDLIEIIKRAILPGVVSCVLDGEVVAYDREKNCLLPFQVLSTRKRKIDGENDDANDPKVKIILQVFDCLYLNGKSLLSETLEFRRLCVQNCFQHIEGQFHCAVGQDHIENGDTAPIETFMNEACINMCEGLMIKTLTNNATYEPSKRSLNWLKLKKDYINGMGVCDSVDLVVMAGYPGKGKRTNVYGAYLVGCYDNDNDEFQSVCKVGTGFKDEDLINLTEKMNNTAIVESNKKPYNYVTGDLLITNDIQWFKPISVWEIQAADLSLSSVHKGGIHKLKDESNSNGERGIGLRFPRFLRERPDKKPENATNVEQIVDMYYSQSSNQSTNKDGNDIDEDDYI